MPCEPEALELWVSSGGGGRSAGRVVKWGGRGVFDSVK